MKKLMSIMLTICILLTVIPLNAVADNTATSYTDGYYTYTVANGEATITDVDTSINGDITIPTTLGGYPVANIGYAAFQNCSSITGVTILNNIKSIDSWAFEYCNKLSKVNITDIEAWCNIVFNNSHSNPLYYAQKLHLNGELVENLVIPDGTVRIGEWAFLNCKSLVSVQIPESVTEIGRCAFEYCSSLANINIPSGITVLEDFVFTECRSLSNIKIPNGVKIIGNHAFGYCTSLTSINIPYGVTTIDYGAFNTCTKLSTAIIPDTVTYIGYIGFYDCDSLTIYCTKNSYANSWAEEHRIPTVNISGGQLEYKVEDNFVTYNTGKTVTGVVSNISDNSLKADKNGYYSIDINNHGLVNTRPLALVPTNTKSYISAVHANGIDILSQNLETVYTEDQGVKIKVYPANGVSVKKYQLMHKTTVIAESYDGIFEFSSSGMQEGDEFFVRIVDKEGNNRKKLKINYANKSAIKIEFESDEIFNFKVPNDVPLIGGNEFKLSIKDLPINIQTQGDTIGIAIGISCEVSDEGLDFSKYRNFVDDLTKDVKNGVKSYKKAYKEFAKNKWKPGVCPVQTGFEGDADAMFVGYCELQKDASGKLSVKAGKAVLVINGSLNKEWQTVIVAVPIVIGVEGLIGVNAVVNFSINDNQKLNIATTLDFILPQITASVGVGIAKVANISVYGSAKNTIKTNFYVPYTTATLSGEIGISGRVLFWSGKLPLIDGDWEYYNSLSVARSTYSLRRLSNESIVKEVLNESNYYIDRSYLATTSQWKSAPKMQTFSLLRAVNDDYSVNTVTELQSDIYNGAAPKVVTLNDGRRIMVWTADIAERSDYNHTAVVYSVYDPATEYWTEPQIISDDGTADFTPSIATDGTNTYVVWCNTDMVFDGELTLSELSSHCEIAYAKFDSENYCFDKAITLTDDALYDFAPEILVKNGKAYISWVKNRGNSPLEMTGTNEVYYAQIGDTTEISIFASKNTPITEHKIGVIAEEIVLAFVTDADGDFTTTDDALIYASALESEPQLLGDSAEQGNIVFANILDTDKLLWYKDGNIVAVTALDSSLEVIIENFEQSQFQVIAGENQAAIIYSKQNLDGETDGSGLYAYLLDANGISSPVCIYEGDGAYSENASGYIDENGNLRIVFLKKTYETADSEIIERTALYDAKIVPNFDITVDDIVYNEDGIGAGENMSTEITVTNNGLYNAEGLEISVTNPSGNVIFATVTEDIIETGRTATITVDIPFPHISAVTEYTLAVSPINGSDANTDDNNGLIEIGYSALALNVEKFSTGNAQGAVLTVENTGRIEENVSLYIYEDDANGRLLGIYSLGKIAAGETAIFNYTPQKLRQLDPDSDILYFEIASSSMEKYTSDNSGYITYEMNTVTAYDGTEIEYYYDMNDDGKFDLIDLVRLKKMLCDVDNSEQHSGRDIDGDEMLAATDVVCLIEKLLCC